MLAKIDRAARGSDYAMTYALPEDMRLIRQYVTDDDFREALDHAPPGIIDPRSWASFDRFGQNEV